MSSYLSTSSLATAMSLDLTCSFFSHAPSHRPDLFKMADFLTSELTSLGVSVEQKKLGTQKTDDGKEIDLPPAVLGKLGDDPNKVGL
jgi:hypothetical protein